jgi:hypothetical protein
MAKVPPLLFAAHAVETVPRGTGVGSRIVETAAQPVGLAESP